MNALSLIIMAAGESTRFLGNDELQIRQKKQWLWLGETPLWKYVAHSLAKSAPFAEVIITASQEEARYMQKQADFRVVIGGASRQESLQNALKEVQTPWVLVSDVARFDVPSDVVGRVLERLGGADCVAPFLGVSDTVSYQGKYLEREAIKLIQTPQLSRVEALRAALKKGNFTDESSAISANSGKVLLVQGSERLKKLTNPEEITLLRGFNPPYSGTYMGSGFDVHAFKEGDSLKICGVKIPFERAFKAHSDGDVGIHALIDAILGAMGAGDIGEWFPDHSPEYAGINSKILLQRVMNFAHHVGFELVNADITIMAQAPKLSPYKAMMEQELAGILGVERRKVSVKATTTESLGFTGRREGIAASASVGMRLKDWTKYAYLNR